MCFMCVSRKKNSPAFFCDLSWPVNQKANLKEFQQKEEVALGEIWQNPLTALGKKREKWHSGVQNYFCTGWASQSGCVCQSNRCWRIH